MTTTATIDLAALAADLEALGWERRSSIANGTRFSFNARRIFIGDLWEHGEDVIECWDQAAANVFYAINLTDPIWQKTLPILLRHVAREA